MYLLYDILLACFASSSYVYAFYDCFWAVVSTTLSLLFHFAVNATVSPFTA